MHKTTLKIQKEKWPKNDEGAETNLLPFSSRFMINLRPGTFRRHRAYQNSSTKHICFMAQEKFKT